jgi:hypothetical protein
MILSKNDGLPTGSSNKRLSAGLLGDNGVFRTQRCLLIVYMAVSG